MDVNLYAHNLTSTILTCTLIRKSEDDLYGSLKGFLNHFPLLKLVTFKQSKNLSIIETNLTVAATASPPVNWRALLTDSLWT